MRRITWAETAKKCARLNNLAALYQATGRLAEAEPLYRRARSIKEKLLGPDHPDVAMTLNNLAVLYKKLGRREEAAQLYQQALSIFESALGPEHPQAVTGRENYARLLTKGKNEPQISPIITDQEKKNLCKQVPEGEIDDVRVGHPVRLKTRAFPDRVFRGVVSKIGDESEPDEHQRMTDRVQVTIDNQEGLLRPGMTAFARIDFDRQMIGRVLLHKIKPALRPELWML
jgi:multidrug efflux pump subunit AcrA (membrane-fusion protein)